jgi:hypothetical protein
MGQGTGTGGRRLRLAVATAGLVAVVVVAALDVVGPAPGEEAAGVVTADALLFLRIPTVSMALDLVAAARGDAPGLDRGLHAARDATGYDLLDPDTWRGLAVDLDAPLAVSLHPAPPLAGVLVVTIPIREGTPALDGAGLLFSRLPMARRPRLDRDASQGSVPGYFRVGGRPRAAVVEWEDDLLVALPLGAGDVEAGLDGWIRRTLDDDGERLVSEAGIRDGLRTHRDAPLVILCRDGGGAPACAQAPEAPAPVIATLFEMLLGR